MSDPMTFRQQIQLAVDTAKPIINDGAATDVTESELALAEAALLRAGDSTIPPDEVAAMASVSALGIEYLMSVGDDDAKYFGNMWSEGHIIGVMTLTFGCKWNDLAV